MGGGLLGYGQEYMPGTDQRSLLDQIGGLLGAGKPYAQALGGLLGYDPQRSGTMQAAAGERRALYDRMQANPGISLGRLAPPTMAMPANDAVGAGLLGNLMGAIRSFDEMGARPRGLFAGPPPKWNKKLDELVVAKNPSVPDLQRLFRDDDALRVLTVGEDRYFWPASAALHEDIGAMIGAEPGKARHGLLPREIFDRQISGGPR